MKQYDQIFVPHNVKEHGIAMDDNYMVHHEGFAGPTGPGVEVVPQRNVIVLTVEELRQVWNAAQDRACALQMGDPGYTKIFESFMQSKGIKL
jgi:hypothetical protein